MKTFKFQVYEKTKWHTGIVTHSTVANTLEEAVDKFYINMQNFGFTKEDIRKELYGQ